MTDQHAANTVTVSHPIASARKSFTIGQLAREFGLTLRTLRFYEDRGLISPAREGSTRLYSHRDRARLSMIVKAKALGFTLSEIKELSPKELRVSRTAWPCLRRRLLTRSPTLKSSRWTSTPLWRNSTP